MALQIWNNPGIAAQLIAQAGMQGGQNLMAGLTGAGEGLGSYLGKRKAENDRARMLRTALADAKDSGDMGTDSSGNVTVDPWGGSSDEGRDPNGDITVDPWGQGSSSGVSGEIAGKVHKQESQLASAQRKVLELGYGIHKDKLNTLGRPELEGLLMRHTMQTAAQEAASIQQERAAQAAMYQAHVKAYEAEAAAKAREEANASLFPSFMQKFSALQEPVPGMAPENVPSPLGNAAYDAMTAGSPGLKPDRALLKAMAESGYTPDRNTDNTLAAYSKLVGGGGEQKGYPVGTVVTLPDGTKVYGKGVGYAPDLVQAPKPNAVTARIKEALDLERQANALESAGGDAEEVSAMREQALLMKQSSVGGQAPLGGGESAATRNAKVQIDMAGAGSLRLIDSLAGGLDNKTIGIGGVVQDYFLNRGLAQVPGLQGLYSTRTQTVRQHLKYVREGLLRMMTTDTSRFSDADRKRVEDMFASEGALENPQRVADILKDTKAFIINKAHDYAKATATRPPLWAITDPKEAQHYYEQGVSALVKNPTIKMDSKKFTDKFLSQEDYNDWLRANYTDAELRAMMGKGQQPTAPAQAPMQGPPMPPAPMQGPPVPQSRIPPPAGWRPPGFGPGF
jgi:hypothetical protein